MEEGQQAQKALDRERNKKLGKPFNPQQKSNQDECKC